MRFILDMLWKLRGGENQQIVEVCENKTVSQFTKLEKMTVDKVACRKR